ncbi:hypothetical protein Pint_19702 [Pistacia integerrima]|uniref:Uncharacterized protein n=1 Tax=Pistacia integerrima TaxID=434235 RepID=A0ACC0XF13_9ROSI|nr:hypothetical protein Pint_19702 [Pistacia integerrima]
MVEIQESLQKKRREGLQNIHASAVEKKLEHLPAMVAGVWTDDGNLQLEATTQFRKLLSIERSPPIEEVIQAGVVPRFVEILMGEDFPQLQLRHLMASSAIKSGALVTLPELNPSSQFFEEGASLRVTGKLQEYSVETAITIIADGSAILKIDTQHLRDLSFRVGSIYQFIGELHIQLDNEAILWARVGRNFDGLDLNLYHQSLQLLRQFQADHMSGTT